MKLKDAIELGYTCGGGNESINFVYNNVTMHAASLFIYDKINFEIQELFDEISNNNIPWNTKIKDIMSIADMRKIDNEMGDAWQ